MTRDFDFHSLKIAVVACSGMGKSTLQRNLWRALPAQDKYTFDHKGQFEKLLPSYAARTVREMGAALEQTSSVCWNPFVIYGSKREEAFDAFCRWVLAKIQLRGRTALVTFDECGDLVPTNSNLYFSHGVREFANCGREWRTHMLTSAQAPTDVPLKLRNQITQWYVGKLGDADCLEPLLKNGFKWSDVARLGKGQFIHYNKDTGVFRRVDSVPEK